MYQVSEEYIEQMMKRGTRRRLSGTIGSVPFTGNDVVRHSFNVSGMATEESDTKLGGVYLGQLSMTFVPSFLSKVARDEFKGLEVKPKIGLWVPDENDEVDGGEWVDVPVGVFTLQAPKISKQGIAVSGYDNMQKLDKPYVIDATTATPYGFLSYTATECGIELGQSQADIEALPNGTELLGLYEENDIETHRDLIYWLAQACGCFACVDRLGKLVFRKLGVPNNITFDEYHRDNDIEFSGYTTKWTGIYITDIETKIVRYYSVEPDDGLTMNLGANPLLQMGTPEAVTRRRMNVLNAVAAIQYTPFYMNSARDPIYDLGDEIPFTGGLSGNCTGCVMAYNYMLDTFTFEGFGDDPDLANARSKTDKNISGLIQNTTENEVTYYNFANLEEITFGSEQEVTIASLYFTAAQKTTVKIMHEFIFDMIKDLLIDGSYEVRYYYDGQLIGYAPYEALSALQITTDIPDEQQSETEPIQAQIEPVSLSITKDFFYVLKDIMPSIRHSWQVRIIAHGIEQVTIGVNHVHITLEGQRMYGENYFDGFVAAKDIITPEGIGGLGLVSITDDVNIDFINVAHPMGDDEFTMLDIGSMGLLPLAEGTGVLAPHVFMEGGFFLCAENGKVLCAENGKRFITE